MRMAAGTLALLMPLQIWVGHWSGEVAHHYQPNKVAAIEGWCETADVQPTVLLAIPSDDACGVKPVLSIPGTSAVLFKTKDPLIGLNDIDASETPPVWPVFWAFRFMIGAGLGMLCLGVWGVILWWRKRLDHPGLFHWLAVPGGSLGFIAVITGWMVAEIGRQPYTVYGALRTADSLSPVTAGQVATSLLVFMVVYAIIFTAGTVYMARIATRGFIDSEPDSVRQALRAPGSPMGVLTDPAEVPDDIVASE
jgi:cytochrome d ubiquinol oxidase subunit I